MISFLKDLITALFQTLVAFLTGRLKQQYEDLRAATDAVQKATDKASATDALSDADVLRNLAERGRLRDTEDISKP